MTRRPCFDRRAVLAGLAALALAPPARGAERLTLWGIPGTPSAVFARAV
ncbi:MAG TPA: ABC transporter substrate-binding protein, partial [Rhodovulum sp.]|nr:ABC transporter substrate-binding protein [Rhodovulum sp.]